MKILITGGSGFIGTNLINFLVNSGHEVSNFDLNPPRNPDHVKYWSKVDIRDSRKLHKLMFNFSPNYVFHLAARTDLNGKCLGDYSSNIEGVTSLISALIPLKNLNHVVFASSMLVCPLGLIPRNDFDFAPCTVYGESKVIGEHLVRSQASDYFNWSIVRPTSLWGPWFDVPYKNFFDAVSSNRYMHPIGLRIHRSYGFVNNAVEALCKLIFIADRDSINKKVFYLADYEPLELYSWACKISNEFGVSPPKQVPLFLLRGLGYIGDGLKTVGFSNPPLTSFRLKNLLTNAVYDLAPLKAITGPLPFNLDEAVSVTVSWINEKHHFAVRSL